MLKISQIKCSLEQPLTRSDIARKIHAREEDILSFEIERQSLDARHDDLHYSYSVYAKVRNEEKYLGRKDVVLQEKEIYELPVCEKPFGKRPVIAGFGPSGMFAALILAEAGCNPIVIERGRPVEQRAKDVDAFFQEGILHPDSNVQYGEGGAGTFSDGKLTTRIKNFRIRKVLEEFVEAGADPAILYQARPHLGTDQLQTIVRNIRNKIIRFGGEIHFKTKLESLKIKDGRISAVCTNHSEIETDTLVLCIGHSASETYRTLFESGIPIMPKDFAAGVRVEHPQKLINENQYGRYAGHPALSAASYRLAHQTNNGRGVYSFCMCPGGIVVPASVSENTLVVNGMSYSDRAGKNANSAILVQIPKKDFYTGHPLDGFLFQERLEKNAWRNGYQAPAQNIRDFVHSQKTEQWAIDSSYPRGIESADMKTLFSEEVNLSFLEAFENFDHRIPGFIEQGIMVGMESRSSSPIRMERKENGESIGCDGLYPCGEGAGYAGGIVSSAVDGIKQAENIILNH